MIVNNIMHRYIKIYLDLLKHIVYIDRFDIADTEPSPEVRAGHALPVTCTLGIVLNRKKTHP